MRGNAKKIFSILSLCCVLLISSVLHTSAAGGALQYFGVSFTMADSGYSYSSRWWLPENSDNNTYYITLPYEAAEIRASFGATGTVYLNDTEIENGQIIELDENTDYIVSCGAGKYNMKVFFGSDISQVFIQTTEPINLFDKEAKVSGRITILDNEGNFVYDGVLDEIKGRGNSTWAFSKKPFNFKLDEKTDLFGLGKSKKFSLLANYLDTSLLKNKLICDFADTVGINYSSKSEIVDLYINENYFGNYTLIERVEIAENRVDIYNLEEQNEELNENLPPEDAPLGGVRGEESGWAAGEYKYSELENNPDDITGGYLLEFELAERYNEEASGFVSEYGQPVIVKSPEFASKEQMEYISSYYQEFEDALLSDNGKNSLGKHYSEYMDVESMAKMYVLQEFVKNLDGGITSFYLYKDSGGKLVAAPVWDFDSSLGRNYTRYGKELADPEGVWITDLQLHGDRLAGKKTIMGLLCKHVEFRETAAKQWEKYFEPEIENLISNINTMSEEIYASAVADKTRWNVESPGTTIEIVDGKEKEKVLWAEIPTADAEKWHADSVENLRNFITVRRQFLDPMFDTDNSYMQYCGNGGDGVMYDYGYYTDGDIITVPECEFTNSDETKSFHGWNTKANGWGVQYMPGDEITVKDSVVLYAQWEEQSGIAKIASYISGLFN